MLYSIAHGGVVLVVLQALRKRNEDVWHVCNNYARHSNSERWLKPAFVKFA